jgi:2,3-diketo-5-methylthio-1-phosphopentane phosphatase
MGKNMLAVICDFDGTVGKTDVGYQIYTRFGDERWEAINKRWRRGEISSRDCLIGEYSLIDASEQEVREFVLEMEIDPGFPKLVDTCRNNNIPIAIASDGFDFYIHALLEKYGLSDIEVFCNSMRFNGRKVELSFPFYEQGCGVCGNCKKLHVQKFKDDSRTVVYVGDGLSDRFAAQASDVVFAKGELMEYLTDNNIDFIKFEELRDVNQWIKEFLAGRIEISLSSDRDESIGPCQEVSKGNIGKLRMIKRVEDMGDGRYIIYYEWI